MLADARAVGEAAKTHWNRPRPFVASPLIHACVPQPPTNSYPSNHATVGMLYAQILARMLPEQRLRLLARARQYAEDRVICGVHYTTDIEAGKRAGAIEAFAMFRERRVPKGIRRGEGGSAGRFWHADEPPAGPGITPPDARMAPTLTRAAPPPISAASVCPCAAQAGFGPPGLRAFTDRPCLGS